MQGSRVELSTCPGSLKFQTPPSVLSFSLSLSSSLLAKPCYFFVKEELFLCPLPSSCTQEWGKGVGTPYSPYLPTALPQSQGCACERLCQKARYSLWVVTLILTTQQEKGLSSCSPTYHNHRAGYFQVSNL